MKRKTYESESIPSQMTHDLYAYGIRDYIKHESLIDSVRWDIKDFINWVSVIIQEPNIKVYSFKRERILIDYLWEHRR